MGKNTVQIRSEINQKIIEALENGTVPFWKRPWNSDPDQEVRHHNVVSKKPYRGVNPFILEMTALANGWDSSLWGTFYQWVKMKGQKIKKGEHATWVVLWKMIHKDKDDPKSDSFPLLRYFPVFNLCQVEGAIADSLRPKPPPKTKGRKKLPVSYTTAELIVQACKDDGAQIVHKGNRAFWKNDTEIITLPAPDQFHTPSHYYETLFHELGHWTELKRHTNWDRVQHGYAMGELRAELCCCYVANAARIPHAEDLENHTAYIKSWLEQMKADDKWIFRACKFADQAADCLLHLAGMNGGSAEEDEEAHAQAA